MAPRPSGPGRPGASRPTGAGGPTGAGRPARGILPNIVIILADDMGYGDVACYNPDTRIPTPHMDRLAAEGMRFTDAHSASSVCTPSRYGILSGRYCWRSALKTNVFYSYEPPLIEPGRLTIASMLKAKGYRTACIGKWHLGLGYSAKAGANVDFTRPFPWPSITDRELEEKIDFAGPLSGGPTALGFDYFFGTSGCATAQPPYGFIENERFVTPPSIYRDRQSHWVKDGLISRPGMMSPGFDSKQVDIEFTRRAVDYIRAQKGSSTPFLLFLPSSTPHVPTIPAVIPEFAHGRAEAGGRGDMVWLFDWMVGEVLHALGAAGKADDTLVLVTSDNGALPGDETGGFYGSFEGYRTYGHKSCGDWRGYKSHIWEGGHREPLLARWPGVIAPGTVNESLCCLNDFAATIAEVVGHQIGEGQAEDSVSFAGTLGAGGRSVEGRSEEDRGAGGRDGIRRAGARDSLVHHSIYGVFSIRRGNWKLILDTKGSGGWTPPIDETYPRIRKGEQALPAPGTVGQLYDLANDPGETRDQFDERPEIVRELASLLDIL